MPHFDTERRIEAAQLLTRLAEIQQTIYSQRQPIGPLEYCVTGRGRGPEQMPRTGWKPFKLRSVWGGYDQTTWFRMRATIPASMKGRKVVALIRTVTESFVHGKPDINEGGEALAYVNGRPYQGLDRNRDELFLTDNARPGQTFEIVLEAVPSTRHDLYHTFGYADLAVFHPLVWDFYWDALVAFEVWEQLDMNTTKARALMERIDAAIYTVDLQQKGTPAYFESIRKAQRALRESLKRFPSDDVGSLVLAGHAHIDTAWLWPIRETKRKCARTFSTVLNLMDRYPEFHFSCSQPVHYEWIKTHYPGLYARIKHRVKEGRWELCGAPWIEPDHNMPAGESLIRQYLYGNRFYEREFGKRSHIAWVPDSFGYTWSLPQIMRKAGLTAFVTTKIDWSQFTEFPYSMFEWEGADGTRIFALMPPLNYNGNPVPRECIAQWNRFKQKEFVDELPFAYGWGDGGGGPTMAMIEHGRRLKNVVGVPRCEFGRLSDCVERMRLKTKDKPLPVYNGELYLELHRACQTTQSRTKRNNRVCEVMLRDTEFLGAMAHLHGGTYRHARLWDAWKIVLTNQFHDILPGSSITEVYTQNEKEYQEARQTITALRDEAIRTLVKSIDTSGAGGPIVVFNTLSWVRDGAAQLRVKRPSRSISVLAPNGDPVPHQWVGRDTLLFQVDGVPPLGHAVYRIVRSKDAVPQNGMLKVSARGMENDALRIRIDTSGCLSSVYDKLEGREILPRGARGNMLQLFDDRPHLHDAWDIDHNFERTMWEPGRAECIKVVEEGPVRAVVRVVRRTARSTITQDIRMYTNSTRLDFATTVDWREKRVLMKVAFPVDVRAQSATYEIQYAAIERPTHHNTPHDRARFENPALRWADLSEGDYGVSLLNDCKYGYDVKGNVLRLSLLRSSVDPDPVADEGRHEFTYSLYPHTWTWRNGTVRQGHELNTPFIAVEAPRSHGEMPPVSAFASVDADNAIIDWVKKCEDSDDLLIRLYEAHGQRGPVTITFARKPSRVSECDLMEEKDRAVQVAGASVTLYLTPFDLRTLKVRF
ncbi:MAG: alpha-mannosidase [Candidatus Hydrogenedentota bacterium]